MDKFKKPITLNRIIFHMMPYDKFAKDYIEKIKQYYNNEEHVFLLIGECPNIESLIIEGNNINCTYQMTRKQIHLFVITQVMKCKKVILHSLVETDNMITYLRFLQVFNRKKFVWMIWGYDLYFAHNQELLIKKKEYKKRFYAYFRRKLIYNMDIITYIEGDYENVVKWYGTKANYMYASYPYHFIDEKYDLNDNTNDSLYIMVGHNASPECRHLDAFDILNNMKIQEFHIICPISYGGNTNYRNDIIRKGTLLFGDKIKFLTDYMPYDEYMKILQKVSIAVFNNNRQQGLGNIAGLLWMGKTVYINKENNLLDFFENRGATVHQFDNEICKSGFEIDNISIKNQNHKIMESVFSEEAFVQNWLQIFKK